MSNETCSPDRISIRIPGQLARRLRRTAAARGQRISPAVREAIAAYLAAPTPPARRDESAVVTISGVADCSEQMRTLARQQGSSVSALVTAAVERYCEEVESSKNRTSIEKKGAADGAQLAAAAPP